MAQNFTVAGNVQIPLEDAGSPAPISLAISFPYVPRADFNRKYDGAVTDDPVNLGTMATGGGAKGVLVKCTAGTCTVKFNGGTDAWPLAAGAGYFLWINSSQGFLTAALVTTTGSATVVFIAVG